MRQRNGHFIKKKRKRNKEGSEREQNPIDEEFGRQLTEKWLGEYIKL